MKTSKRTTSIARGLMLGLFALATSSRAAEIVWDTGDSDGASGDGSSWFDTGNWVGGVLPTSADTVDFNGGNVIVSGDTAELEDETGATGGTLTIQSGGTINFIGSTQPLQNTTMQVDGGTVNVRFDADMLSNGVLNSGTINGYDKVRDSNFTINGGDFFLRGPDNASAGLFSVGQSNKVGNLFMTTGSAGTIHLDIFGDSDTEYFDVLRSDNTLDLTGGTINLVGQGGYTPQIGDSFDLFNNTGGGTINVLSSASNVQVEGQSVTFDTTSWESDGVLTVIPEPSALLLTLLGFVLLPFVCRNRR